MKTHLIAPLFMAAVGLTIAAAPCGGQEKPQGGEAIPSNEDIAAMMEKAKKYTQPGKMHEILGRYIGEWDTESRLVMGGKAMPAEKGMSKTSWLMKGRWIKSEWSGTFLGKPFQGHTVMGYDNFKQSFVATSVTTMDTSMNRSEGDLDPGGKVLLLYGTIDEYLTGEHDKMVKTVWRFVSDDKMIMEIHDLPIGERNTKVVEMTFTRKQ